MYIHVTISISKLAVLNYFAGNDFVLKSEDLTSSTIICICWKKLPLGHKDSSWLIALNLFDNFHQEKRSSVSKSLITFKIISSGKSSNFKSDMMQRASRLVFAWVAWSPFYSEVLGLNLVEADISRIKIIDRCLFSFFS